MGNRSRSGWVSWQADEDQLLLKTVVEYVSEGKNQSEALKEVAEKTGRTLSACSFRFKNRIRPEYESEIMQAKDKKRTNKNSNYLKKVENENTIFLVSEKEGDLPQRTSEETILWDNISRFIEDAKGLTLLLVEKNQQLEKEVNRLQREIDDIRRAAISEEEYRVLLQLLRRAKVSEENKVEKIV